ncbi:MAG: hypothetical protein M3O91_03035 [Chloroflexota bacterium]|nr:hypothetical protein [Chloroflexota bacterium]
MKRNVALIYVRVSRLDREDRKKQLESGADAKLRALSPAPPCRGTTTTVTTK